MQTEIYVINRRGDQARLAQFAESAAQWAAEFQRIAAFDAHDPLAPFFLYRDLIGDSFWGEDSIKPGALGCYLSHAAAWRRLLSTDAPAALIFEDDSLLTRDPADLIAAAPAADAFDVILADDRSVGWRLAAQTGDADPAGFLAADDVLQAMAAQTLRPGKDGLAKAPGANCYLVSRSGAEKLLANLREDRIVAGVDWMILARSVRQASPDWPEWGFLKSAAGPANLTTLIADTPFARQSEGASVLSHKITTPITQIRDQRAIGFDQAAALNHAPEGDQLDPVFAAFAEGRFYEEPALEMMRRWMPEDGVFVDIGAHVGGHTLFMLRHGGAGRAIPMEFNPPACKLLTDMVEMNDLGDRVDLDHLGFGLTEDRGKLEGAGSRKNLSNARLREGFVQKVKTRPADPILRDVPVDMIKIDVNGAEREVLKGMRKTLKRKRPVLALDQTRPRSQKALPLLGRLGYVERERAEWTDAEGDHRFVIFTSDGPVTRPPAGDSEN